MSDPIYYRTAKRLAEEFGAQTVVLISVSPSGLIHTGAYGPHGDAIAVAAMDVALDIVHPPRKVRGHMIGEEGTSR